MQTMLCVPLAHPAVRRSSRQSRKSRSGVTIGPDGPTCINCKSSDICTVDLVGHRIRAATRACDTECRDIMLCTECLIPTANAVIMGEMPYCYACYKTAKLANLGVCMCGVIHNHGKGQALINPDGKLSIYQFCQMHHALRPDSIVEVPLHLLRTRRSKKRTAPDLT